MTLNFDFNSETHLPAQGLHNTPREQEGIPMTDLYRTYLSRVESKLIPPPFAAIYPVFDEQRQDGLVWISRRAILKTGLPETIVPYQDGYYKATVVHRVAIDSLDQLQKVTDDDVKGTLITPPSKFWLTALVEGSTVSLGSAIDFFRNMADAPGEGTGQAYWLNKMRTTKLTLLHGRKVRVFRVKGQRCERWSEGTLISEDEDSFGIREESRVVEFSFRDYAWDILPVEVADFLPGIAVEWQ